MCIHSHARCVPGAGALVSPLVATQFSEMKHWNFHYLTSVGIGVINLCLVVFYFRCKPIETLFSDVGYVEATVEEEVDPAVTEESEQEPRHGDPEQTDTERTVLETAKPSGSAHKMGRIIRDPAVLLISLFSFTYVGLEITIGGWIVTFLRTVRGAGPSAGYVSSGFFGGLTLGRVLHIWVARAAPERYVLFGYAMVAIALQIVSHGRASCEERRGLTHFDQTVWTVKHVVGNAVAISFVGLCLGPFYPIIMNVLVAVLPVDITGGAIGEWMPLLAGQGRP